VLNNFLTNLDKRWDFIIVCGLLNKDFLVDLIETNFKEHKHRITIHQLNIENFTIKEYSNFMLDPLIYELIPTETFITFQLDTLISTKYKDMIYDFIKYDYVGAPWRGNGIFVRDENNVMPIQLLVGNGGLSLRKKSVMLDIIKNDVTNFRFEDGILEDVFFSKYAKNKPSVEEAKLFSVETLFSEKSFGIHACYKWVTYEELCKISEHIPELFELIVLNFK
jgi:hypothetical protein